MSIPTHQISCVTKAYQTTCPDCKELVWFFSCSCGSKVYFNELGYPWDYHSCRAYQLKQIIALIKDSERMSDDEIFSKITAIEKQHGVEIDDITLDIIEGILGKRKFPFSVEETELPNIKSEISGKIMQINNPINIFKKLGYDSESAIAIKLLGVIAEQEWIQIKIRTNPDKKNKSNQYEIFITKDYIKKHPLKQGDFILGVVEPKKHPKGFIRELTMHKVY